MKKDAKSRMASTFADKPPIPIHASFSNSSLRAYGATKDQTQKPASGQQQHTLNEGVSLGSLTVKGSAPLQERQRVQTSTAESRILR
jgi:hypothetical protein